VLILNGKEIFLLCLFTVLSLFPNIKKVKLPGIELEMITNEKEIMPE
jgi:hypothetical protein